jgi:site-specific DNA recombinase
MSIGNVNLATQRDEIDSFCGGRQPSILRTYADGGVSGTIPFGQRPEGRQLLADARLKKFDQLVVYKLDRIGRDAMVILEAVAELAKCGVQVVSITEACDGQTSNGRLMLTIHSAFAAHEREVIRERSIAGTNRVAKAGAWLGGIVPYSYRKQGENGQARLAVSEDPIPGLALSEAEIIRTIYRMAAVERKSCFAIPEHLNRIGAPCAYVRDERMVSRGKRKARTSGLWRPGRVRNLLISTGYRGVHQFGSGARIRIGRSSRGPCRRSSRRHLAEGAKDTSIRTCSSANGTRRISTPARVGQMRSLRIDVHRTRRETSERQDGLLLRCNGKHGTRGIYGEKGQRCPSKDVNGDFLEQSVWADVEGFLRNPRHGDRAASPADYSRAAGQQAQPGTPRPSRTRPLRLSCRSEIGSWRCSGRRESPKRILIASSQRLTGKNHRCARIWKTSHLGCGGSQMPARTSNRPKPFWRSSEGA